MILSGNAYFILMFVVPASILLVYNKHIRRTAYLQEDKSIELAESFFFCSIVFIINLVIFKNDMVKVGQYLIETDVDAKNKIMNSSQLIEFMTKYTIGNVIVSITTIVFYMFIIRTFRLKIQNMFNRIIKRDEVLPFDDAWLNIFETKEVIPKNEKQVISITKGGRLVTAGVIEMLPAPTEKHRSVLLYNTEDVMGFLRQSEKQDIEYRMFDYVRHEYYDISSDVLIKFYDATKYIDSLKEK